MHKLDDLRMLLVRSTYAVVGCAIVVTLCYFLVDRQVALFVHNHEIDKIAVFKWLTYPPPIVQTCSPLALVLLAIRRAFGEWQAWQRTLFIACVSLIVADQFRYTIGDIAGRYWPETWHDDNPSFLGNGTYGFHPFHADDDEGSFPSGHAARIVSFLGVFWIAVQKFRWLYAVIAAPMLIALVAMNYHFVGDVIAGSVVGAIVAAWGSTFADDQSATIAS